MVAKGSKGFSPCTMANGILGAEATSTKCELQLVDCFVLRTRKDNRGGP
jgi:hypothetical protein